MNYGGLGVVLGHELTHGFDDYGSKYDEFGNLNNWWDEKSAAQYEKRTDCMVDQYNSYNITDDVYVSSS